MKFKYLFITFNIVLFSIFLSLFFLPTMFFDLDFSISYFSKNIVYIFILFFVLIGVDILYLYFRKVILLIEKQDWVQLIQYLEDKVFIKKSIKKFYISLLLDCYLITSKTSSVSHVQEFLKENNKSVYKKNIVSFVVFAILNQNITFAQNIINEDMQCGKTKDVWVLFYKSFCLYLQKDFCASLESFCNDISMLYKNKFAFGLSIYIVQEQLSGLNPEIYAQYKDKWEKAKKQYLSFNSVNRWLKKGLAEKNEIHGVLLSSLIQPATKFLYDVDIDV